MLRSPTFRFDVDGVVYRVRLDGDGRAQFRDALSWHDIGQGAPDLTRETARAALAYHLSIAAHDVLDATPTGA